MIVRFTHRDKNQDLNHKKKIHRKDRIGNFLPILEQSRTGFSVTLSTSQGVRQSLLPLPFVCADLSLDLPQLPQLHLLMTFLLRCTFSPPECLCFLERSREREHARDGFLASRWLAPSGPLFPSGPLPVAGVGNM